MAGILEWLLQNHLAGPQAGLLANMPGAIPPEEDAGGLMARPAGSVAPPDGGLLRPGSPLAALFGNGGAQAAPAPDAAMGASSVDEAGFAGMQPSLPPSTNDPQSGEPQVFADGVPLPRPKPQSILQQPEASQAQASAPLSLAPGQGAQQSGQAPQAAPDASGGFGAGLKNALGGLLSPQNAPMLLALGSGFAGAPSFGTGMRRAFGAAAPVAALGRKDQINQESQAATYRALVAKGVPPREAVAATLNPDIMKATAAKYFETKPRQHITITNSMGDQQVVSMDQNGKFFDMAGNPVGASGAGSGDGGGYLAKGVSALNHDLAGEEYLGQFSPEVQAAIKNYVEGKSMPTGNPRKGFTQNIKQWAQKYGSDIGVAADDTTFGARRTMRNQLSSGASGSLGGQINIGTTALGHLADLSEKAKALGNWDIGIAPISEGINTVRGLRSDQAAKMDALKGAAQHYGQEITKFYSGSPGGQEERNRFLKTVDGAKTPQALAAVIETEAQLMHERLQSLESQISGTLGPAGTKQYPVMRPEGKTALEKVTSNVATLRGDKAATGKTGTGIQWSIVP